MKIKEYQQIILKQMQQIGIPNENPQLCLYKSFNCPNRFFRNCPERINGDIYWGLQDFIDEGIRSLTDDEIIQRNAAAERYFGSKSVSCPLSTKLGVELSDLRDECSDA
jgi:hypothetical protein